MFKTFLLFTALLLTVTTIPLTTVHAQSENYPNALLMRNWCEGVENAKYYNSEQGLLLDRIKYPNFGFCWGSFLLFQRQLMTIDNQTRLRAFFPHSCPESGISLVQLVKVFTKHVDENPEMGHQHFLNLATQAFNKAWPCN